ncbi:MAG: aminotransferase class I/II-fold pyridoxal phosphate-dependent enzyme [Actinomycetota bacterium]
MKLPAGPHGGDGARLAASLGIDPTDVLDLSASLNPAAPRIDDLVAAAGDAIGRYPDDSRATDAVAEMVGVASNRLILTNGAAEAIALVAAAAPVGWVQEPEFSLYRRHLADIRAGAPRWRSNPNNPTGLLAPGDAEAGVWDEAFHVLATGRWSRGDVDAWRIGSLTKAFACPGLRIGYVVLPATEDRERFERSVPRWTVNGIAASALPGMVERADPVQWQRQVVELRGRLVDVLAGHGLVADPSDANYVVVRGCGDLRARLAARAVLVRDTASFGFDGVRIAVPDEAGIDRLETALEESA